MPLRNLNKGGQPFFRLSKLCMLEWVISVSLIIYGLLKDMNLFWVGFALFFLFPLINEIVLNLLACCQSLESDDLIRQQFKELDVIPIVYSPGYNITACGFEKLHPFDSTKYKRTWAFLLRDGTISTNQIWQPSLPNRKWLL